MTLTMMLRLVIIMYYDEMCDWHEEIIFFFKIIACTHIDTQQAATKAAQQTMLGRERDGEGEGTYVSRLMMIIA